MADRSMVTPIQCIRYLHSRLAMSDDHELRLCRELYQQGRENGLSSAHRGPHRPRQERKNGLALMAKMANMRAMAVKGAFASRQGQQVLHRLARRLSHQLQAGFEGSASLVQIKSAVPPPNRRWNSLVNCLRTDS